MTTIMNSKLTIAAISLASGAALAGTASAGVMSPPPFTGPMATYQCWTFPTPSTPTPPDPGSFNPYGAASMLPTGGATWAPSFPSKQGVWQLGVDATGVSGALEFRIPNMEDLSKQKVVQIEVKYFGGPAPSFPPPIVSGIGFGAAGGPLNLTGFSTRPADNDPNWTIGTWTGSFDHCPLVETIRIEGTSIPGVIPTTVDWVCIGTNCVPTPGAGSLFAASGLLMCIRRRPRA